MKQAWRRTLIIQSYCFVATRARRIAAPRAFVVSAALTIAVGVWGKPGETVMGSSSVQVLDAEYTPTDGEPFMNERQLEYFKNKLLTWKEDILRESRETVSHLQSETENHPDLADRASSETDRSLELRTRDRQRKLISKIDEALRRIEDGVYGYCEETGEPIGLARLQARPIATLGLEAQERHERRERVHRDD
jgi:DnaK suppressor protein